MSAACPPTWLQGAMVFEVKSNELKTRIGGSPWPSLEEHVIIKASNGKRYTGTILCQGGGSRMARDPKLERNADNMEVRMNEKVKNKDDVLQSVSE